MKLFLSEPYPFDSLQAPIIKILLQINVRSDLQFFTGPKKQRAADLNLTPNPAFGGKFSSGKGLQPLSVKALHP
ncbi:MAG: hypothetical protein P8X96_17345 [Desulfobacteraceae bacterium]